MFRINQGCIGGRGGYREPESACDEQEGNHGNRA